MFQAQKEIEKKQLPLADLNESVEMFLDSCRPLLTDAEFAETSEKAKDFVKPNGEGEHLLSLLKEHNEAIIKNANRDRNNPENKTKHPDGSPYPNNHWLENWWETYAYQSDRSPLATLVNCFQSHFGFQPCSKPLARASWGILGALDFHRRLQQDDVPPERAGRSILCSAQYMRIFGTNRFPGDPTDSLQSFPSSNHICVERRGYWYLINKIQQLSFHQIEKHLSNIVEDAKSRPLGPGIAAFTGVDRSKWANNRGKLALIPGNQNSLDWIEKALFHFILSEDSPESKNSVLQLGAHGNGQQIWFDKCLTHVVFENGKMISNLEHSHADAVVPARYLVYMDLFTHINAEKGVGFRDDKDYPGDVIGMGYITKVDLQNNVGEVEAPWRLNFELEADVENRLVEAKEEMQQLINDHIISCLDFPDFGARSIVKNCGKEVSTDSFMQMSLALAYYRDQGCVASGYETASTRGFFHGRTETIRPQSIYTKQMCEAFENPSTSRNELSSIIKKSADYHRNYLRKCMGGRGSDRLLFGLRMIALENNRPMHPFFTSKAYTFSSDFALSTSQMPFGVEDAPGN